MDLGLVSEVLVPMKLAFREVMSGMGRSDDFGHCPQVSIDLLYLFLAEVRNHVSEATCEATRWPALHGHASSSNETSDRKDAGI